MILIDDSRNHSQTNESAYPFTLQVLKTIFSINVRIIDQVQLTTALTIAVRSAQIVPPTIDRANPISKVYFVKEELTVRRVLYITTLYNVSSS